MQIVRSLETITISSSCLRTNLKTKSVLYRSRMSLSGNNTLIPTQKWHSKWLCQKKHTQRVYGPIPKPVFVSRPGQADYRERVACQVPPTQAKNVVLLSKESRRKRKVRNSAAKSVSPGIRIFFAQISATGDSSLSLTKRTIQTTPNSRVNFRAVLIVRCK